MSEAVVHGEDREDSPAESVQPGQCSTRRTRNFLIDFGRQESGLLLAVLKFLPVDMVGVMILTCHKLQAIVEAPEHDFFFEYIVKYVFKPPQYKLSSTLNANRASWRSIFMERPYAKLGGYYVQQYVYIRERQPATMWDEVSRTDYLHYFVYHYRYLHFTNRGEVLYACSYLPPEKFDRAFRRGERGVHVGKYVVQRDKICIDVPLYMNETVELLVQVDCSSKGWKLNTLRHQIERIDPDRPPAHLPPVVIEYHEKSEKLWKFVRSWNFQSGDTSIA